MTKEEKRHKRAFRLLTPVAKLIIKSKFNYEYESFADIEGPCLVLANHNTDFDPILLGLAAKNQTYFVATENITRMGILGWIVRRFFDPILHYKGMQGTNTIRAIVERIHAGHNVAMFPEGNRSFNGLTCPIPPATGKMARLTGATLITYRFTGAYFASPRWGKGTRKGKITGKIAGVYTHEQLMAMKKDELQAIVERDLYADAYEDQKNSPEKYAKKDRAEGLPSALFMCPCCKKIGTLHTKGNRIFCDSCDFGAEYDAYGYLQTDDGKKRTITELDKAQHEALIKLAEGAGTDDALFSDRITFSEISENHEVIRREASAFTAFRDRFVLDTIGISFEDVEGIAIQQRNLLLVHVKGNPNHYEMAGDIDFSALKYLYLFRAVMGGGNGTL